MDLTHGENKIHGGYVMFPRLWDEHIISSAPNHTREIFILFMRKANHTDIYRGGTLYKRGNLMITYEKIIDMLKWNVGFCQKSYKRSEIESSLKWLRKHGLIATSKTTRGLKITVCNYDHWQTPSNYESHTVNYTSAATEPQCAATINKNEKKDKKEKNVYSDSSKSFTWFKNNKSDVLSELETQFPRKDAEACYAYFLKKMEAKDYGYRDYLRALYNWIEDDKYNNFPNKKGLIGNYIPDERDRW